MIATADFKQWLLILLEETFGMADTPSGYYMDTGRAGLLTTLDQIDAAQASAALRSGNETVASHAGHVLAFMRYFAAREQDQPYEMDWAGSWKDRAVSEPQWHALRADLRRTYEGIVARLRVRDEWPEAAVAAAMILVSV